MLDLDQTQALKLREKDIVRDDNQLTHVINLTMEDDEVKMRANTTLVQPSTGIPFSRWERTERNKPKPVVDDDDAPVDDDDDEDAVDKGPLVEAEMVVRPGDTQERINRELEYYKGEQRVAFDEFIHELYVSTYVKFDVAGMTPDELANSVMNRLKSNSAVPLRPIAHIIEDGGSFKELLTANIDDENFYLPRQWSLWKQTDPVALTKNQVEQGSPEWSAHYANNVFSFVDEENLKEFVASPW